MFNLIFDADDTLWETQPMYDSAKEEFYDLIGNYGFSRDTAASVFEEIDLGNVTKYGFSKTRFPRSMVETIEYLFSNSSTQISTVILERANVIGSSVFESSPKIKDGAKEILGLLKANNKLFLYTAGDYEIQNRRIIDLRFEHYFEKIYITAKKDIGELHRIVADNHLDKLSTWMIGNSLKSDVYPALNYGIRVIWISSKTWDYDSLIDGAADIEKAIRIETLREIPEILGLN